MSPNHGKNVIDFMWKISISIQQQRLVEVKYERQDIKETKKRIDYINNGLIFK
jgi:hypothetical protein